MLLRVHVAVALTFDCTAVVIIVFGSDLTRAVNGLGSSLRILSAYLRAQNNSHLNFLGRLLLLLKRLHLAFVQLKKVAKMGAKKATKKFEKHHLKDTLERRNNLKKTKQKQQLKAKKKARRAEEEGRDGDEETQEPTSNGRVAPKNPFQDMSVDDFFQGGFEVPELPQDKKGKGSKRKRQDVEQELEGSVSESDDSVEQHPVAADGGASESDSDEEDSMDHKAQLDALAEKDPEFHKYLQENEPELLGGDLANIGDLSGSEDEAGPKKKKQKKVKGGAVESDGEMEGGGKNELTTAKVKKWKTAMSEQHSLRAAKEVVLAFRSAAHVADEDEKEYKYSISDPEAYHQLLIVALEQIPAVFQHHLPVQESKSGKVNVQTESKKFKTLAPILRSHVSSVSHLLDNLSDPATLRLTLTSTLPLLPYLLSFKKLVRDLSRSVAAVWASHSNTEATRIAAFLVLRRLTVISDPGIRENLLKTTYQNLIQNARNTTVHTIAGVNLMKNSAAELWGMDTSVGYTTAFTFIRQLAVHLRSSITNNSNESYKQIYNWQYTHSLDFWSRVMAVHAATPDSPMRPLIYPLVQVTLGALRLIPTATYFPLRSQLLRSLLRISLSTNTYIPLAPALYEVLNSAEMRRAPKASTLKPLDFNTTIRAAKSYLRTRVYQDGVGEQVVELLSEFLVLWAKNIAFPELALPITILLKRWLRDVQSRVQGKGNKNSKLNSAVQVLVQKVEANVRWIEERRVKVEFSPKDRRGVEGFLADVGMDKTPLGAFVVGQRRSREEKARLLEAGRKEEEAKRVREREGEKVGLVEGSESESEGSGVEDEVDGDASESEFGDEDEDESDEDGSPEMEMEMVGGGGDGDFESEDEMSE